MRKLSVPESERVLETLTKRLDVPNVVVVYGDHLSGKLDVLMSNSKDVDPLNFGENAIEVIRELLRRIDRGQKSSTQEQAKSE